MRKSTYLSVFLTISLALVVLAGKAKAEVMKDLYTASWPVADQTTEVRNRAMGNAFAQVLVRASGSKKVLNSGVIKSSLSNASSYMRLYSYKKLSFEEQKIYKKPLLLKVSFEPKAVTNLLQDAGQPIWNNNRPSGVYWIAVDKDGKREIAADGQDAAAIAVTKQAYERGLPVVLPLMDLDDKSAISSSDVWGKFAEPVNRASKRYGADYIVMGGLSQSANGWQGSWKANLGGDNMSFTTNGRSAQQAVAKMVNRVADRMAMKLAVVLNGQVETDYLKVKNLTSIESYAKVQSLLKNLSMVTSVNAVEVYQDEVLFELGLQSSTEYLIDALEISNNLRRTTTDSYSEPGARPVALVYNWRD